MAAAGIALLLGSVIAGCSSEGRDGSPEGSGAGGDFCDAAREVRDSDGATVHSSTGEDPEAAGEALDAAVDRQEAALERLRRTAPEEIRADVDVMVRMGRRFAEVTETGDVGLITREDAAAMQSATSRVSARVDQDCGFTLVPPAATAADGTSPPAPPSRPPPPPPPPPPGRDG